jgi:prepilin-type N-terminal cleavage/methylation domain-containing protein
MAMQRARGMTLIEMVLAIVIVSIVLAASAPLIANTFQSYFSTRNALDATSKARLAVERIAREIRDVNFTAGAYAFSSVNPGITNNTTFTKTDGVTTVTVATALPQVTMGYSSVLAGAGQLLTDDVASLGFQYLREDLTNTGVTAANVRFVEITLTLNVPGTTGAVHTERTRVALRDKS